MVALLEPPRSPSPPRFTPLPSRADRSLPDQVVSVEPVSAKPVLQLVEPHGSRSTPAVSAVTYHRRRVVAFVVVAALVWLTVSTAVTLASWAGGFGEPVFPQSDGPVVHIVSGGDTVWSVARQFQPDGDVRPLVDSIIRLNGSTELSVGQQLLILP